MIDSRTSRDCHPSTLCALSAGVKRSESNNSEICLVGASKRPKIFTSQFGIFHWAVVWSGTVAEFILPILLLLGLFTRLAALGMIGFVFVQSLTDIYGHGADEKTIGAWFDRFSDAHIMDQRAFWVLMLLILVIKGAGPLSLDRILKGSVSSED